MRLPAVGATVGLMLLLAEPLAAQERTGFTLDASLGAGVGANGPANYHERGHAAAELTLGRRGRALPGVSLLAVTVGRHLSLARGDVCRLDRATNRCRPKYPDFAHLGLLAGGERFARAGTLRVLAGPAIYGRSEGASGVGGLLHVDVATPPLAHVALMLSARGSVLLASTETFRQGAVGVGLRIE